ncbi:hypothetical protein LRS13_11165 [Svornostia abyssi]|uniref:Uncharacterized protein n=1 Tax=Svornostia abyssi TaxID=2898438 RepID=A0ABY5PMZ4_9ACTN|nr:hypothetical protein LRS13_11165 [Parviterribacteraceae bacterium J379]
MTQTTDLTPADLADAPTVDEAVAALTAEQTDQGVPMRRIGGRRRRASAEAPETVARDETAAPAASSEPDAEPVGVEDFGPYVTRLMAEARSAAAAYRRDTEREAAERAAEVLAKAAADAAEIRAAATRDAEAVLAAARVQAQALSSRVSEMAAELHAGAEALAAAPAADAEEQPAS